MLYANFMTLCFMEPELLTGEEGKKNFRPSLLLWPWSWPDDLHKRTWPAFLGSRYTGCTLNFYRFLLSSCVCQLLIKFMMMTRNGVRTFRRQTFCRSTVGRTPVFGRRTDPVLRSACSRRVTTMWVNHPLQVSQLGRLSLSSFRGR